MRTLEILSKKLKFVEVDPMVKTSKALKDVQPELEKLRQKAVSKVICNYHNVNMTFFFYYFLQFFTRFLIEGHPLF